MILENANLASHPVDGAASLLLGDASTARASAGAPPGDLDAFLSSFAWLAGRIGAVVPGLPGLSRGELRRLLAIFDGETAPGIPARAIRALVDRLGLRPVRWRRAPLSDALPAVVMAPGYGYALVYGIAEDGAWLVERPLGRERVREWPENAAFLPLEARVAAAEETTARALFDRLMSVDRGWIAMAAVASTLSSILLLGTSLYSMQVYDRVMGQGGISTLIVLTVGVLVASFVELLVKLARSAIVDRAVNHIDTEAAIGVFRRLLAVRVDQFPSSVGTLAAQVRGFETIRAYRVARTVYFATDFPFALLFLTVILMIAGPLVAVVPAVCFVIAASGGLLFNRRIARHSATEILVGNRRQGLLVETIQSAEFVKATGAGWQLQGRWNDLSRQGAEETVQIKRLNDRAGYFAALIQQFSYVGLVATGAWLAVTSQSLTTGAIIACSIVSGRVLGPVSAIPGLLVQAAHARVAMDNLERLFALECDNHGQERPLVPAVVRGGLRVRDVEFAWPGQPVPVAIKTLDIAPGERVGVIGAIGAGKSTLLRLLAGLLRPERGTVMLDELDIQHIAPDRRAELIAYLPQTSRLLGGTLRDNLTLGLVHTPDDRILAAMQATGLAEQLAGRSEGLDLPIPEGGEGLSGGQRQLVAFTRLLLGDPSVWLLDEPTASMDDGTERRCLTALAGTVRPGQTLVLVTHKVQMLELVDRLIVLGPQGVVLDGPRQAVIERLRQGVQTSTPTGPQAHPQQDGPVAAAAMGDAA